MKLSAVIKSTAALVLAAGLTSAAFAGEGQEHDLTMDQVPAAVQSAVKGFASVAEIKGIEDSDADGTRVIEFDLEKNGQTSEVAFRPDGRLFSTEQEVNLAAGPAAGQETIAKKSRQGKAGAPEKLVQEGKTSYEVAIEREGKKIEYTISPEGKATGKEAAGQD